MRNRKLKFRFMLISVCLAALLLSACGNRNSASGPNESGGDVTLQFWTIALQPTFTEYFNKVIRDYESSHPGVKIQWSDYPYDAVSNKLLTTIASGKAPDVVNLNTEFTNQMATKGALADLSPYLNNEQKQVYFEGIFNSTVFEGKPYSFPWYTGTEVLFMNKKMLEQAGLDPQTPPKTRDELDDWARKIKEKLNIPGYGIELSAKLFPIEGIPLLNEDKTAAAFNTPEALAFLQKMKQRMDDGIQIKDNAPFKKQIQYYSSEQSAFVLSGPTFINFIKTAAPDIYKETIAVPLPTGSAGVRLSNSMDLVIPAKSTNPEAAAEFAAYLTNAESQTAFSKEANTLPSAKESIKDPFFTETDGSLEAEAKVVSAESLDKAVDYMVGVPSAGDINTAIGQELQEIFLNGKDIQQGLNDAEQEVNSILGK